MTDKERIGHLEMRLREILLTVKDHAMFDEEMYHRIKATDKWDSWVKCKDSLTALLVWIAVQCAKGLEGK